MVEVAELVLIPRIIYVSRDQYQVIISNNILTSPKEITQDSCTDKVKNSLKRVNSPENIPFPLYHIPSSLQVMLSMSPPTLLCLRSQKQWIIFILSSHCSTISSALPLLWCVPAASCCFTAWSATKLIPHHNRSQLQVICHCRDSNPIMCPQKTLKYAQAHTDISKAHTRFK